jgi:type III secretory pathway component EscS
MASLQTRVVNILKSPATEWPVIAAEPADVGTLYRGYIMPLSAIPVIASFIGLSIVGVTLPFTGMYRQPMVEGISHMVVSYVLGLVGVYLCAMVLEWLAPKFNSSGSRIDALKLVAYASTPMWVAGVLNVLPLLGVLALVAALYAIYLFYLGLPVLMKTPADQVVVFMIVAALVMFLVSLGVGAIAGMLTVGSAVLT